MHVKCILYICFIEKREISKAFSTLFIKLRYFIIRTQLQSRIHNTDESEHYCNVTQNTVWMRLVFACPVAWWEFWEYAVQDVWTRSWGLLNDEKLGFMLQDSWNVAHDALFYKCLSLFGYLRIVQPNCKNHSQASHVCELQKINGIHNLNSAMNFISF